MEFTLSAERAVELRASQPSFTRRPLAACSEEGETGDSADTPKASPHSVFFPASPVTSGSSIRVRARRSLHVGRTIEPRQGRGRLRATRGWCGRCRNSYTTCSITLPRRSSTRHLRARLPGLRLSAAMGGAYFLFSGVCRRKRPANGSIHVSRATRTIEALSRALDGPEGLA